MMDDSLVDELTAVSMKQVEKGISIVAVEALKQCARVQAELDVLVGLLQSVVRT